jgi:two-component system phosphate regulon response regulator PhoB
MKRPRKRSDARPSHRSATRVLVVEDEPEMATLLAYNLEADGYVVECVERGEDAELRLAESSPDLMLLDWILPGLSGLEICRRLRAREKTRMLPVIMITGRAEEAERIRGLSVGADDYVVKPFSVPELLARVRALLRRSRPTRITEHLSAGELWLDRKACRVTRCGRDIQLSPTDFRMLEYLMERPGRVFSREELLDGVWGLAAELDDRSVDVRVGRLRRALSKDFERDPIRTVRGVGYAFDEFFEKTSAMESAYRGFRPFDQRDSSLSSLMATQYPESVRPRGAGAIMSEVQTLDGNDQS